MDRLVDYFAVVGCDPDSNGTESNDQLKGKVLTRIPEQDWDDEPFIQGIELFCQPNGWFLTKEKHPPKYFYAVLTDADGKRHYCAILSFSEPIHESHLSLPEAGDEQISRRNSSQRPSVRVNLEEVDESMCEVDISPQDQRDNVMKAAEGMSKKEVQDIYLPKCLILISKHQEFTVFKNCLGLIYTIYIESLSVSLETVIAKLLAVNFPAHGAQVMRFSIGAADKQALQASECEELPITRSSVSMLLRQLGILNVMNVLTAALVDQKLLFYSCSFSRLSDSCNALTALMFPFTYSYPYIPILPRNLLECTSSPTPFLIGVHSSLRAELHDLVDVIAVDLDGGVISVPECISIPCIPEPYYTRTVELLTKVLCPDLVVADYAYPPEHVNTSEPEKLDKEIRAIFLRLFCQLLRGYRACLQVCRIHPRPIIRFQKGLFLLLRRFDKIQSGPSADFMPKLVESQAFSLFIQEKGPPYRRLNVFDREVANVSEQMKKEGGDITRELRHIKELSSELYKNENPTSPPPIQKVPKPSEGAYLRPHQTKFPRLSPTAVQAFMMDKLNKNQSKNVIAASRPNMLVPDSPLVDDNQPNKFTSSNRRLDVLKSCVQFIFESRTLETKKIFHAVLRTLKNPAVRGALACELKNYVKVKPCLDNQQFDYIARLCNQALDDCSGEDDEYALATDLLPVLSTYYRKLCPTVMQFLYTVVQEHLVWALTEFWEYTFFLNVQSEMVRLYNRSRQGYGGKNNPQTIVKSRKGLSQKPSKRSEVSNDGPHGSRLNAECLDIVATELRDVLFKNDNEKIELGSTEEGVIVGQIQHTAQIMIFLLVPLCDTDYTSNIKLLSNPVAINEDNSNSYFTSSLAGSTRGSLDEEDGSAYQHDSVDLKGVISKFVTMFVDRVSSEAGISAQHSKALLSRVSGLVLMQLESLQDVSRESRNLPPIKKVKLLQPKMLPGELLYVKHTLRAYLAYDGRLIATGDGIGGPRLLPAEGAIFVSNYRIMFIGIPCDSLASEQVVIRSFPISALFKVRLFTDADRAKVQKIEANVQHWGIFYSSTYQLLVIGFDEDVDEEHRIAFEQKIHLLRNPSTIEGVFAIRVSQRMTPLWRLSMESRNTERNSKSTLAKSANIENSKSHLRHGAKSFVKQAKRKAGLGKQQRLPHVALKGTKTSTLYHTPSDHNDTNTSMKRELHHYESNFKLPLASEVVRKVLSSRENRDKLQQLACCQDFERMNMLGNHFHLTTINHSFSICRSYPVCAVVPKTISDDSMRSLSYCHYFNRFPCVVWMHAGNNAVLIRASAIRSRTAAAISKHNQSTQSLSDDGTVGSSAEIEKFFVEVVEASLANFQNNSHPTQIVKNDAGVSSGGEEQNKSRYKGTKVFNSFRDNRPESVMISKPSKKWGTLTRVMGRPASEIINSNIKSATKSGLGKAGNGLFDTLNPSPAISSFSAVAKDAKLHVFVDKNQFKTMKPELQGKVRFMCLDLPEPKQVRSSFKSVLKACLPADVPPPSQSAQASAEDLQLFRKMMEGTGWLQQVSTLLWAAGTVVELMDVHKSSVMFAIEGGWDTTPQITSLVQLLLDPYYRTIKGFQTLVQKEWISFGHRFSHRNHFNEEISSGFTPIFLQFLDCVYQVLHQFPLAFEFNPIFLQTLAYHCTSNRFNTFILDSDYERIEAGILFNKNAAPSTKQDLEYAVKLLDKDHHRAVESLWDYISHAQERSKVFLNTLYCTNNLTQQVLRPITMICRLCIWPYFVQETLADCPIYDGLLGEFDTTASNPIAQETTETGEGWGVQSGRRVVNPCYDNISEVQPNAFCSLMQQVGCLLNELDKPLESWRDLYKSAINLQSKSQQHKVNLPTHLAREEAKLIHKRLVAGIRDTFNRLGSLEQAVDAILWPNNVDTLKPGSFETFNSASLYQVQTTSSEVRTYEGMLWKQGAYMKNWKQRYFVLDSTKHQLRQYESKLDQTSKTIFDMKEVESVRLVSAISGAPKGVGENAFFEMKTSKRLYHFIAESNDASKKWIDALQNALEA